MGELIEMREEVVNIVVNAMKQGEEYEDSFEKYAYLWMDDPHEFMQRFLTFGHALTTEELESHAEEYLPHVAPTLDQFQLQVRAEVGVCVCGGGCNPNIGKFHAIS